MPDKQLMRYKKVHMVGIKGAGMTALAEILLRRKVQVSGSDTSEKFFTDRILDRLGIEYQETFAPENIPKKTELVIYSTAYSPEKNPELVFAKENKIPILSYPEALGQLSKEKMTLAVCGSHGKTTTSALLAETLKCAGKDPLAIVGSRILAWEGNALAGASQYFVLEADEYQNKLAFYQPFGVILTSADWDHPDFFPDAESHKQVFRDFVKRIPPHGFLAYCNDLADVKRIADEAHCQKFSYGFLPGADFQIKDYKAKPAPFLPDPKAPKLSFRVKKGDEDLGEFQLKLAGRHNALNATAVLATGLALRLDLGQMRVALARFAGTERRLEYLGERYGAPIYDDYAHHPEEIRATLAALRELYPNRRLRAIFQPHTFSRTEALFSDFAQSFEQADEVFLLPIYASAREREGTVTSEELVTLINRFFQGRAVYAGNQQTLVDELKESIGRNDVLITLGAGDGWRVARALAKKETK